MTKKNTLSEFSKMERAYKEGKKAGLILGLLQNPYPNSSQSCNSAWYRGWLDGRRNRVNV